MLQLTACEVDLELGRVVRDGVEGEALTVQERALLQHLVDHAGEAVDRSTLLTEVWGYSPKAVTRAVDVAVRRLRQKVEADPGEPDHILTERGVGYRFVGPEAPAGPPVPDLVGRDEDLAWARQALERGGLVTLQGPAGMGTTALARALAPDAAWVAGAQAAPAVASGVVVLDGAQADLVAARAAASQLLAQGVRVVATSQVRLGLPREQVRVLGGLSPEAGARLLRLRSQATMPGWGDDDEPVLRAVSAHLDGWPLALELAAARAEVLTPGALLEALGQPGGAAALLRRPGGPSFVDAVAATVGGLPDGLAARARQVAVFRGPFEVSDAEAVVDGPELAIDWLQGLLAHSVLVPCPVDGRPRFRMPGPIAAALRQGAPAVERYAQVVLDDVEAAVGERYTASWRRAERRLADRAADVAAVWSGSEGAVRWRAAWLASRAKLGAATDRQAWLEAALAEADAPWTDRLALALAYEYLSANRPEDALALLETADPPDGEGACEHALVQVHATMMTRRTVEVDDLPDEEVGGEWAVRRWHMLGAWHASRGELDQTAACFARMRDWALDLGHELVQARALTELAQYAWLRGDVEGADVRFGEALDLLDGSFDATRRGVVLLQLGGLEAWQGDEATARMYTQEGYDVVMGLGHRRYGAMAATNLGRIAYAMGERTEARRWLRRAAALQEDSSDRAARYPVALFLALTSRGQAPFDEALRHATEAVALARSDVLRSAAEVVAQLCGGEAADTEPLRAHGAPLLAAWASLADGGPFPEALEPATVDLVVFLPSEWRRARS